MTQPHEESARLVAATLAEARRRDRRTQAWLFGVGLALLATLVWAGLREVRYTAWHQVQLEYQKILSAKASDEFGVKLAEDFDVRIRQVVVPALGVVDRCVACHNGIDDPRMTDVPNPHRKHPGDLLAWHEPSEYGCTICHRGQGRALVFPEAKAVGYHWPYPLLPKNLTQAACGQCHAAEEVRARGGELFALGKDLFETGGCTACHKLAGRGGSLGPELTREGHKVPQEVPMARLAGPHTLAQWLLEHFRDPQAIVPGSQMKPVELTEREFEALTIYVLSLQARDLPARFLSPGRYLDLHRAKHPPRLAPAALFERYCAVCHDTGTYGRYDKTWRKFIPAVRGSTFVQLASAQLVDDSLRRGRPGTLMAAWAGGLYDEEIGELRDWLLATSVEPGLRLSGQVIAQARDPSPIPGDASAGAVVFERHCAACHGSDGLGQLGPALANPVLQNNASDGFLFTTIAHGRRDTAMPAFLGPGRGGFDQQTLADLVAWVRALGTRAAGPLAVAKEQGAQP